MVDSDGATEILGVNLTPKNWATLCKQKQQGWFKRNGTYSLDQLEAEIQRLTRLQTSYKAMLTLTSPAEGGQPVYPYDHPDQLKPTDPEKPLQTVYTDVYKAQAALNTENATLNKKSADERKTIMDSDEYKNKVTALDTARKALSDAIEADKAFHSATTKFAIATLSDSDNKSTMNTWITSTLATIQSQIDSLEEKRKTKLAESPIKIEPVVTSSDAAGATGDQVATDGSELANPVFGVNDAGTNATAAGTGTGTAAAAGTTAQPAAGTESDPWTTISATFSATDQMSTQSQSSWGMSAGGGAGWGLWSVGGSYSHDESHSSSTMDMATCDVSIAFDVLVVNIGRPWLYGEVFGDFELDVADGVFLSPGAQELQRLMLAQNKAISGSDLDKTSAVTADQNVITQLAKYNLFPAYPTSFIVAANTIIDFHGDTQHIEDHFNASSTSGSMSVGWGPFSVSSSFHQSSSDQTHQMQSTATGCRLTFGAPQIIAWVSEVLPALPRPKGYEPMVQNIVESRLVA